MAGLDTRGLASGFAQGFGLMNQYQQQQRQNERADRQMDMQEQKFSLDMETAAMKQEQFQQQRDVEDLKFTIGKIAGGMEIDESELTLLRQYPKYWAALDPQTDASINQAMAVIDPNTPVDANNPESLEALNQMFGAEINRGEGGQKRVVGMYPAPDGQSVALELEVVGEDGNTYTAPMTEGRGTADDDLVKYVPVEALVEQVQGMRMLRNTMRSPEAQQQASQVLALLRGESQERWEQVQGPGGSILQRNASTGEMKSVIGRTPQQAGGGQGAPTATMKEAQWMVDQGIAADIPSAFETLRRSRGDDLQRDRLQMQTISGDIDTITRQLSSGFHPDGEQGLAALSEQLASLRAERDQLGERIFDSPASGPNQSASQQGASRQAQPSASAMGDEDILNSILRDL